jgi:hypothetical protein
MLQGCVMGSKLVFMILKIKKQESLLCRHIAHSRHRQYPSSLSLYVIYRVSSFIANFVLDFLKPVASLCGVNLISRVDQVGKFTFMMLLNLFPAFILSSTVLASEWITEHDGVRVFYKEWIPTTSITRARVIAIHGLGDNIERYDEMFKRFADKGIKTIGMDLRGFGQTFELQNTDLYE